MIKCDTRARQLCPFKNQCCGEETAYFVDGSECDKFNQKVLATPPTNADRIRAMSDEELSMVIMCPHQLDGKTDCTEPNCFQCALKWLKKPEEDDHA